MYSQKLNCAAAFQLSTFMFLGAIYIYISTIGTPILLQQTRQIMEIYKLLTEQECGNWERGRAFSSSSFIYSKKILPRIFLQFFFYSAIKKMRIVGLAQHGLGLAVSRTQYG